MCFDPFQNYLDRAVYDVLSCLMSKKFFAFWVGECFNGRLAVSGIPHFEVRDNISDSLWAQMALVEENLKKLYFCHLWTVSVQLIFAVVVLLLFYCCCCCVLVCLLQTRTTTTATSNPTHTQRALYAHTHRRRLHTALVFFFLLFRLYIFVSSSPLLMSCNCSASLAFSLTWSDFLPEPADDCPSTTRQHLINPSVTRSLFF